MKNYTETETFKSELRRLEAAGVSGESLKKYREIIKKARVANPAGK